MRQGELPPPPPRLSSPRSPARPRPSHPWAGWARLRLPRAAAASLSPAPAAAAAPPPSCTGTEWRRGAALRKRRPRLDGSADARSPSEASTLWLGMGRGGKAGRERGREQLGRATGVGIETGTGTEVAVETSAQAAPAGSGCGWTHAVREGCSRTASAWNRAANAASAASAPSHSPGGSSKVFPVPWNKAEPRDLWEAAVRVCRALREQVLLTASGPSMVYCGLGPAAQQRCSPAGGAGTPLYRENGRDNLMPSGTTEATLLFVSSYSPRCGELVRLVNSWWELFCVIARSTVSSQSPQHVKNQDEEARNINVQAIKYGCRLRELACWGGDVGRKFFSADVASGSRGGPRLSKISRLPAPAI